MTAREYTFDVFGRVVIVRRESQGWAVFEAGADGKRGMLNSKLGTGADFVPRRGCSRIGTPSIAA